MKITGIKLTENECFENEEYCIKLNGTSVKHGKIRSVYPSQQLCLFLTDILAIYFKELLGRDDVLHFITQMKEKYPVLIQETMKYFSVGEIRQVLCGLLQEKVSIQNIVTVFETIANFGDKEHNMDLILENVRKSIGRYLGLPYFHDH